MRERLGMAALHLRAQAFDRAELQLLDSSFAFAEPLGDFPDAALVDKALVNDAALRFRKLPNEAEQPRAVFDGADIEMHAKIRRVVRHRLFTKGALRTIDNGVGCNSQQPGHKRNAAPFVTLQIGQRFVKHFGGQVLGGGAVVHTAGDKAVHAFEMQFVERVELRRVGLRRLDEQTLLRLCISARLLKRAALGRSTLPSRASGGLHRSVNNNWPRRKKLRHLSRLMKVCKNAEAGLQPCRSPALACVVTLSCAKARSYDFLIGFYLISEIGNGHTERLRVVVGAVAGA